MKHRRINYKQLFKKYPMGYARYRDWLIDMSRMCAKYPLDCDFLCGAWLLKWRALGRLLTKPEVFLRQLGFDPERADELATTYRLGGASALAQVLEAAREKL